MAWHIQEFGKASDVKQRLSQSASVYEANRDAAVKASLAGSGETPALLDKATPEDEKFRQAVVNAILAALEEAKGDVHVNLNVLGHSQLHQLNEAQVASIPGFNKETRQVTLTVQLSTSI